MRIASSVLLSVLLLLAHLDPVSAQGKCSDAEAQSLKKGGVSDQKIREICGEPRTGGNDTRAAVEALRNLATAGNSAAAFELGRRYEAGDGVIKDYVEAYVWYSRAFSQSGATSHKAALDALEKRMQPADIAAAQTKAKVGGGPITSPSPAKEIKTPSPRVAACETVKNECWDKADVESKACIDRGDKESKTCLTRANSTWDSCDANCKSYRGSARDRCEARCEKDWNRTSNTCNAKMDECGPAFERAANQCVSRYQQCVGEASR